jgi:circadian clock protein KaiB
MAAPHDVTRPGATFGAATWHLRLYVAGPSPKSMTAHMNLRRLCEEFLGPGVAIEVIDLLERPHLASADQILAIPTLIRILPTPVRRVVGDLSEIDRVVRALDLRAPELGAR